MLEKYRLYIVVGIIVGLAAAAYVTLSFSQKEGMVAGVTETGGPLASEDRFVKDGYLLTGHPELKEGVWYLVHSQEGDNAKAAELKFNAQSVCAGSKASGSCRPDRFVNMREARVEGVWEGEQLIVEKLTFTAPIQ